MYIYGLGGERFADFDKIVVPSGFFCRLQTVTKKQQMEKRVYFKVVKKSSIDGTQLDS